MSQTNWLILAVGVIVLVLAFFFWPGSGDDTAMPPADAPAAEQPADADPAAPATDGN